jgi:hypothetical protein
MPPIVIGGICRFSYEGTYFGRPWANVLHFDIDTDIGDARADAIRDQAKVLNNEWIDHWAPILNQNVRFDRTSYVDLDSLTGITGDSTQVDAPRVLPSFGAKTADPSAANLAVLVRKNVSGGRSARPGRIYVLGLQEADADGNNLFPTIASGWQAGMTNWLNAVNQESSGLPGGATYSSRLAVTHVPATSPPTFGVVQSLSVDSLLATQRRRLRG